MDPILILWIGGGLAVTMLLIGVFTTVTSERSIVQQRLGQLTDTEIKRERPKQASTPLTNWLNRRVEGTSWAEKVSRNLARADIKIKPGEYIALLVISGFFVGFVFWFLTGRSSILLGIPGVGLGVMLPGMYVKSQQGKRLVRFNDQLGDMLNLMVNGLRAGYSTMQAMEAVSKELPPPISDEFRRVVQEMQLGVPMERAMDNLLRRIPSDDLDLVLTAINVQREVGGNLAEILDTISFTIRERVRIKGEIRVLTSQVMYSGRFLSLMPIFVVGILYLLNRAYIMELFKNGICGYIAMGVAVILIIAGYFAMNKLAEIEI